MRWNIYLLFVALQLFVTFPRLLNTCTKLNPVSLSLYVVHQALDVFLFWSVFFVTSAGDVYFHILYSAVALIHWITNQNRCISTVWLNQMCGYPEDEWLDSILNRLRLREWSEYYQFLWIGISIGINWYRI
jgi:hypothetical protein